MVFRVIGIGNKRPVFTKEQLNLIKKTTVFSGGMRHFELVKDFLPEEHHWIAIKSPMKAVFKQYEAAYNDIIVFASGNPLFYGVSNTLRNQYPEAEIYTEPYFSSIQLLANKTSTNSNELVTVSVHGRDWKALDSALIHQYPLIGVLTDQHKNPKTIAERLLKFGYTNYEISIGEDLEGPKESVKTMSLVSASKKVYNSLNCILLHKVANKIRYFGIKDAAFIGLEGRPHMITKMPIRLTSLHLLDVMNASVFWDIGFCTGSVSIEAKLKNPALKVIAFEKRPESESILLQNQQKFGVPGIQPVMGDFFKQDLLRYEKPDAIFVGGHGGRLSELLDKLNEIIFSETRIVINTVQESSKITFKKCCKNLNWELSEEVNMSIDLHNPIVLLKAIKK